MDFSNPLKKILKGSNNKSNVADTYVGLERFAPESVPYACHFRPDTILTKNGELLQVIKLEDFHSDRDVRAELRQSVANNIKVDSFAIVINTVRRRKKASIPWNDKYTVGFCYDLHKSWEQKKKSHVDYQNEIYISILSRGMKGSAGFPLNFSLSYIQNRYHKHLSKQYELLSSITNNISQDLQHFYAKKLVSDENGNSELLKLFRSFLTLLSDTKEIKLPIDDISNVLVEDCRSKFGFNSFEVMFNNTKRFGSVLGIKRYREVEINSLSMAINFDMEFIITESIDFDNDPTQLKSIKYQNYLLEISGHEELRHITQLSQFEDTKGKVINHSINIIPIANSVDELETSIPTLIRSLSECGLGVFRHDLSLENAFLTVLPGNFAFKTVSYLSVVSNIAGFALLHTFISGKISCEQWGYAITLFWSIHDTPYFFNFHNNNNSHATIVGPFNSGKTVLQNFIISQAKKLGAKVYTIDCYKKSKIFIQALDGVYKEIEGNQISLGHNPFIINDSEDNRNFMYKLINSLTKTQNTDQTLKQICDAIFSLPVAERNLTNLKQAFNPLDGSEKFFDEGGLIHAIFADGTDSEDIWSNETLGFDFNETSNAVTLALIVLNKIESILDGRPTIIVLEEAWKITQIFINKADLVRFLTNMRKLNCVVIFTSSDTASMWSSEFTQDLKQEVGTQIFLPGNLLNKNHIKYFNITKEDMLMITNLQIHNRHFFLKQGKNSIVLKLDISDMIEGKVLSSNEESIKHMEEAMAEAGSRDSIKWLPLFYKKISM